MGETAWIVFHNPDWCNGPAMSPMVRCHWNHPVVELLFESEAPFSTNDVDLACARFIGWCYSHPDAVSFQLLSVSNIPGRPDPERIENKLERNARLAAWYRDSIARLGASKTAVLVNMATLEITQGGARLWGPSHTQTV